MNNIKTGNYTNSIKHYNSIDINRQLNDKKISEIVGKSFEEIVKDYHESKILSFEKFISKTYDIQISYINGKLYDGK